MQKFPLYTILLLGSTIFSSSSSSNYVHSFSFLPVTTTTTKTKLHSAPSDSDFAKPRVLKDKQSTVDPNKYNIDLETAAELWTASISESNTNARTAGIPYLDSKSKDYFVDDILGLEIERDGGLGIELLELAGGREDGIGITIVSKVTPGGNAEKAGILPGDSIASVTVVVVEEDTENTNNKKRGLVEETKQKVRDIECRDFDNTIDALANFPDPSATSLFLDIKRMRRWPKVKVTVEYPPSQVAEGVSNIRTLELFAGENLQRALLNRGIILDDPGTKVGKCDFCGQNACYVSIYKGVHLLNPKGFTEEKLMKKNPNVRISCKTTVGYNMQEGELGLRVNLSQWQD